MDADASVRDEPASSDFVGSVVVGIGVEGADPVEIACGVDDVDEIAGNLAPVGETADE